MQNTTSDPDQEGISALPRPRPPRFPIRTTFRYRESGASVWRRGVTIDISRTGVLFEAELNLPPRTALEMLIGFPSDLTGGAPAAIFCCGPIVRNESSSPKDQPAMAAYFLNYRFVHQ